MKGNFLLLSLLLLPSVAFCCDDGNANSVSNIESSSVEIQQPASAQSWWRFGGALSWLKKKASSAGYAIFSAGTNLWSKVPSRKSIASAFRIKSTKDKIKNFPAVIRNNKIRTAGFIGIPVATIVAWKWWKSRREDAKAKLSNSADTE